MSTEKKRIYKPSPISGFPEWLPEERLVELKWFDHIRRVFESYGFCSIETPSVEALDAITAKGEVDKEIYVLERLHKDDEDDKEARLALHFDQTVPFARYTAQHFNNLTFPFKRYQMQRVWRGERPQMGRMREFYQCDIDVINVDNLPLSFDAEVASVVYEALEGLDIGRVQLRISNRKILMGYYEIHNILDEKVTTLLTRAIDKTDKFSLESIVNILDTQLETELNIDKKTREEYISVTLNYIKLAETKFSSAQEFSGLLRDFITRNDVIARSDSDAAIQTLNEGIEELRQVLDQLSHLPEHAVVADLSIVRGLDYYTGTVYETQLLDVPEFTGSVCSGGRYDNLASEYINKHLPGVGISIGFSRLFDVMLKTGRLDVGASCPTDILVYTEDKDKVADAHATARTLRQRGFNVETYNPVKKWEKHLKYAEKKGIPYIWYPDKEEVKNLATGNQEPATPEKWEKN